MKLVSNEVALDQPGELEKLWEQREIFGVLPDRCAVDEAWIRDALGQVPGDLHDDGFGLLSSGSTGEPKLVIGSRHRAAELVALLHEAQHADAVRETICVLPLSYSYALVNQWLWSREFGRRLVIAPGNQAALLRSALDEASDAMLCLVGAHAPLLGHWFAGARFPGVIRLHFAGGRFPEEHVDALRIMFPRARLYNNYGCIEAMPRLTVTELSGAVDARCLGKPLAGIELSSDDADRLSFRSPFRALGVAWRDRFRPFGDDEWVDTGDLARPDADGGWVLLGRASEVFKRHGEKVSVSQLLGGIGRVWHGLAACYRDADAVGEDGIVLVLSPHPSKDELRALLRVLRSEFSRAQWPLRVESVAAMARLHTGKVDTHELASHPDRCVQWKQRI